MELSEKMVLCGVLEKAGATAVTVEKRQRKRQMLYLMQHRQKN